MTNDGDFSIEPAPHGQVWVKHHASGHVFKFTVLGDNTIDEHVYIIATNAASGVDAATLVPGALAAARRFYFPILALADQPPPRPPPQPSPAWMGADDAASQIAQQEAIRHRRFVAAMTSGVVGPIGSPPSAANQESTGAPRPSPAQSEFSAGVTPPIATEPPTLNLTQDDPASWEGGFPRHAPTSEFLTDFDAIPPQLRGGSQFTVDASRRIDLVADPPDLADPTQHELYAEMRPTAQELTALGHNELGDLAGPASAFLEAVTERVEDASIVNIWSRGNKLRNQLGAHRAAATSTEPDPARLPLLVEAKLADVVEIFNVFAARDPRCQEFDRARLGPEQQRETAQALETAAPLVEAARETDIATPAAAQVIAEQIVAAQAAPDHDEGRTATLAKNTITNFLIKVLHTAYGEAAFAWEKFRHGVYTTAGSGAVGTVFYFHREIIEWVVNNADNLKNFFDHVLGDPVLLRIIDAIAQAISLIG
jgi:hypothetical protein